MIYSISAFSFWSVADSSSLSPAFDSSGLGFSASSFSYSFCCCCYFFFFLFFFLELLSDCFSGAIPN